LPEASGLAASRVNPDIFWGHNDSAEPYVFAVDGSGQVRGRVRIAGASVADWEAITAAPCGNQSCLYIGDIGDNNRARPSITIYRTVEPAADASVSADAVAIEGAYPEGPQDAEAMFVVDGSLFVVTKGEGKPVRLYRFPAQQPAMTHTLQLVATLAERADDKSVRITDAAVSPDGRWVALRSNQIVLFYDAQSLMDGRPGMPRAHDLRALNEPQGEGLAWADAETLVLAGEGDGAGTFARLTCSP
jgi:hypothetical protein